MKLPGIARLQQATRRIRQRRPKALVLMYHRVAEAAIDPWGLCVTPQHFAEHMAALHRLVRPTRLRHLAHAVQAGKVLDRAIAVTFDDGYADNLFNARPILERYAIPATVFLVSGQIGGEAGFWWDELARLLLQPDTLPARLCLQIDERAQHWEIGTAASYSEEERRRDHALRPWESVPGSRYAFYYALWQRLRPLPHAAQQQAMQELRAWAGDVAGHSEAARALRPAELAALARDDLVEIGAHTVTHPLLSAHPVEVQRAEIQRSKAAIERMLDRPVWSFSYPFGDYSAETVAEVRGAGFECACTVEAAAIRRPGDRWQLPRFEVLNWDGDEFVRRLEEWFYG